MYKPLHFIFPQPDGWVTVWVRGLLFCLINVTTMTNQALLKASLTVHSFSYFNSWAFFSPQEKLPLPFPFIIASKWKCHIFLLFTLHSQDFLKLINYKLSKASLEAQTVKNLSAMQETRVWSLGQEKPLEEEMATNPIIPAWRMPWTEDPGRLQSMGSKRVGHDEWLTYKLSKLKWVNCF